MRKSLSFLQMTVHKTYFSVLGTVPAHQPHALKPIKQHGWRGRRPLSPHAQETHLSPFLSPELCRSVPQGATEQHQLFIVKALSQGKS